MNIEQEEEEKLALDYSYKVEPFMDVGIDNAIGTIDSNYRGEVKACVINNSLGDYIVNNGDRVCQLAIREIPYVKWEVVNELSETNRGANGFGSSGNMTDEEMAEEYVTREYCATCKNINHFCKGKCLCRTFAKNGFLDGLNEGKPKWHKVADGDLPKNRRNVWITYINAYHQTETTEASFRHKYWVINGHRTECDVIAWCEIPKYTEE